MLEKHKIASKAFITRSLRQRVDDFLEKRPEANIYELYFEFPKANPETLKSYKSRYWRKVRSRLENLLDWKLLSVIGDILKYKAVLSGKLTQDEVEAIKYLDKIVSENYRGGRK